jgi:hypothetical protein
MYGEERQGQTTPPVEIPRQPSEWRAWLLACALAATGAAVLACALTGVFGGGGGQAPPALGARAHTPAAGSGGVVVEVDAQRGGDGAIVGGPSTSEQTLDAQRFRDSTRVHISRHWMEGFYPIYAMAQSTFGVNWLLIASIHMQESAFSTAPGTYHGLNFAHCCGGPMQFNITNGDGRGSGGRGSPSTWDLVSDSYILRPAPRALRPHDRHAPVDLRRLRRDHGGRAPALGRRRRL